MKELVYNNPDFCKQRAESKPLSEEATKYAVECINDSLFLSNQFVNAFGEDEIKLIQAFIWEFENLRHFKAVHECKICNNCEVNYEIVKGD
jgi:hypothetical protein